jgi:hypothetical protein
MRQQAVLLQTQQVLSVVLLTPCPAADALLLLLLLLLLRGQVQVPRQQPQHQ